MDGYMSGTGQSGYLNLSEAAPSGTPRHAACGRTGGVGGYFDCGGIFTGGRAELHRLSMCGYFRGDGDRASRLSVLTSVARPEAHAGEMLTGGGTEKH